MNFRLFLPAALFFITSTVLAAEVSGPTPEAIIIESETPTPVATIQPTPQPTAQPTPDKPDFSNNPDPSKALVIHKPKPSPAWGKVIQYHREKVLALSDQDSETLHEFIFQDDKGIVRTAIFHENASGDGYWEVWVWDQ